MTTDYIIELVLVVCIAAVLYHHIGYPILLRSLARAAGRRNQRVTASIVGLRREALPSMTIIVPAYNEQDVIAEKIENLARLKYPADRLTVIVALDGCTDATKAVAEAAIARVGRGHDIRLVEHAANRGKIAVLNEHIEAARTDIVAPNDASGMIDADALMLAAQHFADPRTGVVCATYRNPAAGSRGEADYWQMQTRIMRYESEVAAPMGAHGALYFFRRALWEPLPPDTINDDFVLPMDIVADGYRSIYDPAIIVTEIEPTTGKIEFGRRTRIGAGNLQQVIRLMRKLDPRRTPGVAFLFLSGKGMRPFVPFLILLAMLSTLALAARGDRVFQYFLGLQLVGLATAAAAARLNPDRLPRPLAWLSYLVVGHTASALGAVRFITGHWQGPWGSSTGSRSILPRRYQGGGIPPSVAIAKRAIDIAGALVGLVLLAIVLAPIALAIKLETRGPVFFRQQRVGRSTPTATHLFDIIKFRSMRENAEAICGPVLASEDDPRVTRVGRFLRKTRLDELPQFVNVLKGEMSLIGPRPERSVFVRKLHDEVPFFPERTLGLRPGLTGYAQVHQTYEQAARDVPLKAAFDHAYAMRLSLGTREWLRLDLEILLKTIRVVCLRTGH